MTSILKEITEETAKNAVRFWCDDPKNVTLVTNAINCVYQYQCQNKRYYCRITHDNIRTPQALQSSIAFQAYLYHQNVPICQPVLSQSRHYIEEVSQGELTFVVHVCQEVPGEEMHFHHKSSLVYENWGKVLASLHQASKQYVPEKHHHYMTWQDLDKENAAYLQSESKELKKAHAFIHAQLKKYDINQDTYGLIHADHREANVLCSEHTVHIIDFDEPVYHFYMMDVARAFLTISSDEISHWQHAYRHFISGYHQQKSFTQHDLAQIPYLVQSKSLSMYVWAKNNWLEPIAPGGGSTHRWLQMLYKKAVDGHSVERFQLLNSGIKL